MKLESAALFLPLLMVTSWFGGRCAPARADGGMVRLVERHGRYEIAVFTAPTPFRAGPVDLSVLVQDADDGEPVLDASVTLTLSPRGRPGATIVHSATTAMATNKLLRASQFDLPEPGWWDVSVNVDGSHGTARVHLAIEAAEPSPRWPPLWAWLSWPALAIALFGVHEVLVWRKSGAPPRIEPVDGSSGR